MQKDYMAMAQGQQAPQESPVSEGNPADLKKLEELGPEEYSALELPSGQDDASIKQRVVTMFERLGLLEGLSQEGLLELQQKIDDYIQVFKSGNMQAIKSHPITRILDKAAKEMEAKGQQQAPMMPPGGGMSGR